VVGACAVLLAVRMRDAIRRHWTDSARGRSTPNRLATAPD
jgi:hypothetical protein